MSDHVAGQHWARGAPAGCVTGVVTVPGTASTTPSARASPARCSASAAEPSRVLPSTHTPRPSRVDRSPACDAGRHAERRRPRRRPRELFADHGYDHDTHRCQLRQRGITPRIARHGVAHGSGLGRHRWVVERGFAGLHSFKRLRTRYERRADTHLGLLQLTCALICYRQLVAVLK